MKILLVSAIVLTLMVIHCNCQTTTKSPTTGPITTPATATSKGTGSSSVSPTTKPSTKKPPSGDGVAVVPSLVSVLAVTIVSLFIH